MEKFSNFRDKATGILPFLPPPNSPKPTFFETTLKLPIFIIRLPIFIILVFLYVISSPIPFLNKLVGRLYLFLICNLWTLSDKLVKNLKLGKDDFIIVNFSSVVDFVILEYLNPNSVYLINDLDGNIRQITKWQLCKRAISKPNNEGVLVNEDIVGRGKLVWYFPEGTTSNNKCLLLMSLDNLVLKSNWVWSRYHVRTLTMIKSNWINTVLPQSWFSAMWLQLSNLQKLKLYLKMSPNEIYQGKNCEEDIVRNLQLNRLKSVKLGMNEKLEFLKAYEKRK